MVLSMLDQILFPLRCGHDVVLGRLENRQTWACDDCEVVTDLTQNPFREAIEKERDTAKQIDLQVKERGGTVERAG
jgi:hypothetical protein